MRRPTHCVNLVATAILGVTPVALGQGFVHFESPQVHPLERTPDGSRLLVANTAAGRLEVYEIREAAPFLRHVGSVAVGVEPVSVRARSDGEAWVVSSIGDAVSVVDLDRLAVVRTIATGDEPCDVVFAGVPERAFVSVAGADRLEILDPADLDSPAIRLALAGRAPRALETDGLRVYATLFGGGNGTTVVPADLVSSALSPYPGSPNPPPNDGLAFTPALDPALPAPAPTSLVVRQALDGRMLDANGFDWSAAVGWRLADRDLAIVEAGSLATAYASGLLTIPFDVALAPDGRVVVVGTDLHNEVRFEPNLDATFVEVEAVVLAADGTSRVGGGDLNPHLPPAATGVPLPLRLRSIGDPRTVVVAPDGSRAYATGMGSSSLIAFRLSDGARLGECAVGEGPTGLALDAARARLFVLNRFAASVSVVDAATLTPLGEVAFHDPVPFELRRGRRFLYDSHLTSGRGQASCASCHVDARSDGLVWDMGDPAGALTAFNQVCNLELGLADDCGPWHPMKGPMATQTLLGLAGNEPHHWRGDRAYIANFAHLARTVQGMERDLTETELKHLDDYLTGISMAPNPNRRRDGSLADEVAGGDPARGEGLFAKGGRGFIACGTCHAAGHGGGAGVFSATALVGAQALGIPDLRQAFAKTGFDRTSGASTRGFGYGHDGAAASVGEFLAAHVRGVIGSGISPRDRRDLAAFVLSWETGTHPSVGRQVTLATKDGDEGEGGGGDDGQAIWSELLAAAESGAGELAAHRSDGTRQRGYLWNGAAFASDDGSPPLSPAELAAAPGGPLTLVLHAPGRGIEAIDRDRDGHLDGVELGACSDPSDPASVPGEGCRADLVRDGEVDAADLATVLLAWGSTDARIDLDCSGSVDSADLALLLAAWGACGAP